MDPVIPIELMKLHSQTPRSAMQRRILVTSGRGGPLQSTTVVFCGDEDTFLLEVAPTLANADGEPEP